MKQFILHQQATELIMKQRIVDKTRIRLRRFGLSHSINGYCHFHKTTGSTLVSSHIFKILNIDCLNIDCSELIIGRNLKFLRLRCPERDQKPGDSRIRCTLSL